MRTIPAGGRLKYLVLLLVPVLAACSDDGNPNYQEAPQPQLKDFWVNDALSFITRYDSILPNETLQAEVAGSSAIAKMFFDGQSMIYKITFVDQPQFEHHYYLENGLLSYSRHTCIESNEPADWFLAYAQHLPYAAAKKAKDGTLNDTDPVKLPWRKIYAAEVRELVERYQMYEKQTAMVRIHTLDTIINDEISPNTNIRYTLNAAKREKLHIELRSATPNIFFMLKPMPGADMVRKIWNGEAQRTGDLYITVFSIRDDAPESFELRIKPQELLP